MSKLYEDEPIKVTLDMHVFHRCGDFVIVQYFTRPSESEAFIYNTKTDKCYGGYYSIYDDELVEDWKNLTGEGPDEEDE
jgi:hypothetical protein